MRLLTVVFASFLRHFGKLFQIWACASEKKRTTLMKCLKKNRGQYKTTLSCLFTHYFLTILQSLFPNVLFSQNFNDRSGQRLNRVLGD